MPGSLEPLLGEPGQDGREGERHMVALAGGANGLKAHGTIFQLGMRLRAPCFLISLTPMVL